MSTLSQSSQTRPTPKYQIGDTFRLSQETITRHFTRAVSRILRGECDAWLFVRREECEARLFVVEQWYDHTVEHMNNGDPHGHPRFHELIPDNTSCLYLTSFFDTPLGSLLTSADMVSVPRPIPNFKVGDTFLVNEGNFGTEYAGKLFVVEQWYDHYLPEELIDDHPHGTPAFDVEGSAGLVCLYDTTFPETSLYEWDMEFVSPSERHLYQYTQLSLF